MDIKSTLSRQEKQKLANQKPVTCGYCGKTTASKHFAEHYRAHHGGKKLIWDGRSQIPEAPYCENWRECVGNLDIEPVEVNPLYKKGGDRTGRSRATKSIIGRTEIDPAEFQDMKAGNEEEKKEEAVGGKPFLNPENEQQVPPAQSQLPSQTQPLPVPATLSKDNLVKLTGTKRLHKNVDQDEEEVGIYDDKMQQFEMDLGGDNDDDDVNVNGNGMTSQHAQSQYNDITLAQQPTAPNKRQKTASSNNSSRGDDSNGSGIGNTTTVDHESVAPPSSPSVKRPPPQQAPSQYDTLRELYKLANANDLPLSVKRIQLLNHCHVLADETTFMQVKQDLRSFEGLVNPLLVAYAKDWNIYTQMQVNGFVAAAFLFKDTLWVQLPGKVNRLSDEKKVAALVVFKDLLIKDKFSEEVASWFVDNIHLVDEQTLKLIEYMNQEEAKERGGSVTTNSYAAGIRFTSQLLINVISFSSVVALDDTSIPAFVMFVNFAQQTGGLAEVINKKIARQSVAGFNSSSSRQSSVMMHQKMSFDQFDTLLNILETHKAQAIIKSMYNHSASSSFTPETQLKLCSVMNQLMDSVPLHQWVAKIEAVEEKDCIDDAADFTQAINDLKALNNGTLKETSQHLPARYTADLRTVDSLYRTVFTNCKIRPNELQFAIAQYAIAYSKKHRRQLWTVPAGQGKSRILAAMGMIALLQQDATRVHFVFNNRHLMQRDQRDFGKYWMYLDIDCDAPTSILPSAEAAVQYHCSLESIRLKDDQSELILVDEADELIFGRTQQFMDLISKCRCVCLTATPTNKNEEDAERQIIQLFEFQLLKAYNERRLTEKHCGQLVTSLAMIPNQENYTVPSSSSSEGSKAEALVNFVVNEQLVQRPVLLYCDDSLKDRLQQLQVPFYYMNAAAPSINEHLLRKMDTIDDKVCSLSLLGNVGGGGGGGSEDETMQIIDTSSSPSPFSSSTSFKYQLVVATDPFAMRGFDFRTVDPEKGISLVVARSFATEREAVQGLNRVGRYGDYCRRILIEGVPLVDETQSFAYSRSINKFIKERNARRVEWEKEQERLKQEQLNAVEQQKKLREEEKKRQKEESRAANTSTAKAKVSHSVNSCFVIPCKQKASKADEQQRKQQSGGTQPQLKFAVGSGLPSSRKQQLVPNMFSSKCSGSVNDIMRSLDQSRELLQKQQQQQVDPSPPSNDCAGTVTTAGQIGKQGSEGVKDAK